MTSKTPLFAVTRLRRQRPRLTRFLLAAFVLLALVPAVALTFASALRERGEQEQATIETLSSYADSAAEALDEWAASTGAIFEVEVSDPAALEAMLTLTTTNQNDDSFIPARRVFEQRAQDLVNSTIYDYIVLVDMAGVVEASSDQGLLGQDLRSETWFRQALLQPGSVIIVGPQRDPISGQQGYAFALAVVNPDPEAGELPTGVLAGLTGLSAIQDVLNQSLPGSVLGRTGDPYVVREGGQYVIPPRLSPAESRATDEIVPEVLSGQDGSGSWVDYNTSQVFGAYRWIDSLNVALVLKQDSEEALATVNERIRTDLFLGGGIALAALFLGLLVARLITSPMTQLSESAYRLAQGDFSRQAPHTSFEEFERVADSLNVMTEQINELLAKQEEVIRERTRQLHITAQLGREISSETDPERLLQITINAIRDQLGYYHAQIFLLDDLRQYAVLRASTGEAGQTLLSRGHRLSVGSRSVIGQVTSTGIPVIANDTASAENWMPNPLLPETRAELAVPIRLADQIMGALDVQSSTQGVFDEQTIAALQTIADQLAVALRNSQLFEEKEGLISASVQLTQMLTRDSWDSYLSERTSATGVGFSYDLMDVKPLSDIGLEVPREDGGNGHGLNVPIALRGEMIGELEADLPPGQALSEEERNLVGQVLDRVALALENARLFEQTQLSLQESTRLYQASRRIAAADTIETLANEVVELAALETIDRVILFLLENSNDPVEDRWASISKYWLRDPKDPLIDTFPERLHTNKLPLAGIEQVEASGLMVRDMDKSWGFDPAAKEAHQQMGVKTLAIFPMVTGRRTVGWLVLHSTRQSHVLNEAAMRYYRTLADQAATALEGLRLLEQTQIRARRLAATNEVSRAASSILNPDILLPLVVEQVHDAFGYYHVQVFLVDEMGEWAVLRASTGEVGQKLLASGHKLEVGSQSVIGQVTASGEPFIVRDTDTDPLHKRNELLPNTRSEMALPLKTGDRVIGAIDVQSTEPNAFDLEAQAILQSLAGEIAVTMENAQLFQEIQDRVAELTTINLVSQAVSRANTLEEVYEVVATQLQRTFGARYGYLAVFDSTNSTINLPLFIENGEIVPDVPPQQLGSGVTSYVIQSKQVLLINENLEEEARRLGARIVGSLTKSMLAVPMLLGEDVIGVISIQDQEQEHAYNEAHVRQLTTLAAYIAVKIRNAELLMEAQRRAGELGFLFNVTRAAVATSELDASLGSVAEILVNEIAGAEAALIYLASPDGNRLEPRAAVGYGRDIAARGPIAWDQGLIGHVATTAQPLIDADALNDPRALGGSDERTRSVMSVPLMTANALIGVLMVGSSQANVFGGHHLRLLETASSTLTAIIQNARLLDEISRANEQLKELDRLKSQFLANMSHELRTPLNSIIGFSRVMLKGIDGPMNDLQTQDLNTIYNSGQHLLGLINNILDLSKLEARMMEIQPEYTSLPEIIDTVMAAAKGLTKEKPIELYKEIEPNLPQVWGDPQRIRQVLLNLVSNAEKFTKEGSLTVRAFRCPADASTGEPARVQIDVIDTGIGIPEDKIDLVFEAFQQVDGSTTRQYEGTGLGLPISRQFVELHGGRMWVQSTVGKGSTFSFTVPLHPVAVVGEEILARPEGDTRPLVLAVDDEPGVIDLYTRYLEKEGYAVVGLGHANDLVRHVQELQPSAIILDLNLPGKDGWLAINDLKQNTETQQIPVIVCTITEGVDPERLNSVGAAGYLVKPVIEEDLLKALHQALDSSPRALHNILVIDANQEYGQYVKMLLESTGYFAVRAVTMGFEGLQVVNEVHPSVLIIDLDLNDMDGFGLLVAMRSHPETSHVPTLILTAREVSAEEMAKVGPEESVAYVSKYTFDPEQFVTTLYTMLERASRPA